MKKTKKRYAFIGTGGRVANYIIPLAGAYSPQAEAVALMDTSQVRMDAWNRFMNEGYKMPPLPVYKPEAFDKMIRDTRPDVLIINTIDSTHHTYIAKGLDAGCEVITEKPMTTSLENCRTIFDAVSRNGKQSRIRVTFNYRWSSYNTRVKELLSAGVIGNVKSVNMEYLLDTYHGADYFRRWHSDMRSSGGLLVHKSTHHFDLVNWWIDAIPQSVFANGNLAFYGEENAINRGDERLTRYPRYTGYVTEKEDPFAIDLSEEASTKAGRLKAIYYDAEKETGYIRDQNVFRKGIDIYDSMSVGVKYRNGVLLTYSLDAYSSREGMRVTFNGDRGRLEYYEFGRSHMIVGQDPDALAAEQHKSPAHYAVNVYPHFSESYQVPVELEEGGHGGADPKLQRQIFDSEAPIDHLGRDAGHEQGAASVLIGIAANRSIKETRAVNIETLFPLKPGVQKLSELDRTYE